MGTVSELCVSSFQAFLCPTVQSSTPGKAGGNGEGEESTFLLILTVKLALMRNRISDTAVL